SKTRRIPLVPLGAAAVLALASCIPKAEAPGSGPAPGKNAPGVTSECSSGASHGEAPYRYNNNQWGRDKAHGTFEQCLLWREVGGVSETGWTWNWPGFDPTVFAYPEIIVGWKPWDGGASTDPRFPMRVENVHRLVLDYKVEMQATGSYNLAPEIWL